MKTEIWNGHEIRFVNLDEEWWAVAKDVAEALGYSSTFGLTKRLRDKYKGTTKWRTLGGVQELVILSEQGVYKAIMNSHKPEAEEFEDWIFNIIKELRQSTGLEGFQVFRMLDKEHQKSAMQNLKKSLREPVRVDFIKANVIANKAVSNLHGFPKMVKKAEMTPEMLIDRQEILDETTELMGLKDKFNLDFSVSEKIYNRNNRQQAV
ncbi:BRO-N domain-containing protein [Enterococcus sp. DIV0170]|uniref:BRO-N domain-containing protein n=1 Tax=Enterococcus sp. DIV0170 TaxID=2774642 RepID=UPI003F27B83C